ncbi:succinate-semialdehyde dehydrogenase / glutarate-semialdehyde dehydrogenase [Asanoa hainanensis]|uniref:Succinate-semialdehyde dehydrogenase / glutarate-semialdehyde dehydrogenase n=1 Tax=Asanoa hainanensis TaxID=560556 RepID=A0A239N3Z1_9ACTN|nr:aldehyde dehydrogenase family protein [Asanoa hainanensis]SNT48898.1 succinate-semialdehyde dehydrogenase / glutarate-semialdehyde dehydrogenase [Asanoa hainanensis]
MPIATIDPTTGQTVKTFEAYDAAEVRRRLDRAVDAAATLRETPIAQRADWMRAAADIVENDLDRLARMLTQEMGKPITQARAEVHKCVRAMRFEADHVEELLADQPLAEPDAVGASQAWTTWQPLGVVLAVMPWNFALWQVMRFAAPALLAGNAGLLKHASNVPQAALYLDSLFERAGFPPGSFQALLIPSSQVAGLIQDDRIAAVTITGSEPAGRSVAETAGKAIKKSVLELGGSDPFIVMPGVDLDTASSTAVRARVQNNGQSCIAAKRFVVHTDIYDDFVDQFTAKMADLVVGDPMDEATDVGPLATESGRRDLAELVDDATAKGADVLVGGNVGDGPGWFYPPTALAGLTDDMRIVTEEAFGPVAAIYRVSDRDEAVRVANQTSFGLSSAVWSPDADEQAWFVRELDAGAVFVNGMSESSAELPFGGVKASGYGREMGTAGIHEFCNLKAVWKA